MAAASFTIFYSWESDLPNATNRGFIQGELEAVAKELSAEGAVVEVDRDTEGVAGSPDIGKTILAKIEAADAFVADLSIISDASAERKTPNPNVVFELGWAYKALGENKVVTVLNRAFGGPENLPFDLKQRKTLTYELRKHEDKTDARKELRGKLRAAIKAIVDAGPRASAAPAPSPTKEVVDAIEGGKPNQFMVAKRFLQGLTERLVQIDAESKKATPPARMDSLLSGIERSKAVVNDFGIVARVAAEMGAQDTVHGLVQGFEYLLARYDLQGAGTAWPGDFDLFRFVGHELLAVLAAHLIRAERWTMFPSLFAERIHNTRAREPVSIDYACATVELLDRTARSGAPILEHAQILKERHEATAVGDVSFPELIAGDVMLYLGVRPWFPWSAIFIARQFPRFLSAATSPEGARALAAALNTPILVKMKIDVTQSIKALQQNLSNMGAWRSWEFDPAKIYTG